MLIVIMAICIALIILGIILTKSDYDYETASIIIISISVTALIMVTVLYFIILNNYKKSKLIDEKITYLEVINKEIESDINVIAEKYLDYEKDIITNIESLVVLIPELKANEIILKQLEIYTTNKKVIKEYRLQQINGKVLSWWLWFGNK